MMKKAKNLHTADIGTALDGCSWDYAAPKRRRDFFLNPLSSFFGDFPWEGQKSGPSQGAESRDSAEAGSDVKIL